MTQGFADLEGDTHEPGESWTFVGYSYLPYEDGLSLFVSPDGQSEWHIMLQWRSETQAAIIDALEEHVRAAP